MLKQVMILKQVILIMNVPVYKAKIHCAIQFK